MKNTLEDLRRIALKLLETQERGAPRNAYGSEVSDLLQELSIY